MYKYHRIRVPKKHLWIYNNKKYRRKNGYQNLTRDEHRLIMEKHLKRRLKRNEVVDHINGNKNDNRIRNLRVMSLSEHTKMHYLNGDYKAMFSKQALQKRKRYHKLRRLPHTKNEFTCCCCKKLKSKNEFYKEDRRWNKLRPYCIECIKESRKKKKIA
jgi:hypothetical protein